MDKARVATSAMPKDKSKISEETIRLTPEQMEAVKQADEAFERGEALTSKEVREMARQRTESWMKTPRSKSA